MYFCVVDNKRRRRKKRQTRQARPPTHLAVSTTRIKPRWLSHSFAGQRICQRQRRSKLPFLIVFVKSYRSSSGRNPFSSMVGPENGSYKAKKGPFFVGPGTKKGKRERSWRPCHRCIQIREASPKSTSHRCLRGRGERHGGM